LAHGEAVMGHWGPHAKPLHYTAAAAKVKPKQRAKSAQALRSTVHEYSPQVYQEVRRFAAHPSTEVLKDMFKGPMEELARTCGASVIPETTPRGTFSVRVVFDGNSQSAPNDSGVEDSSAGAPSHQQSFEVSADGPMDEWGGLYEQEEEGLYEQGEMADPPGGHHEPPVRNRPPKLSSSELAPSPLPNVAEEEEEEERLDEYLQSPYDEELEAEFEADFEDDEEQSSPVEQSSRPELAPQPPSAAEATANAAAAAALGLSPAEEAKTRKLYEMLMSDPGNGNVDDLYTFDQDRGLWVEAMGAPPEGEHVPADGETFKPSPLVMMQQLRQKDDARFKHMGSTKGQLRGAAAAWPGKVNKMRKITGERRDRMQGAVEQGAMRGILQGAEAEPAAHHTEADEWQAKFEMEADRIHELELELQALKGQLGQDTFGSDVTEPYPCRTPLDLTSSPGARLGGEEPYSSPVKGPPVELQKPQKLAFVPAIEQDPHPLHRKGGVPQLKQPVVPVQQESTSGLPAARLGQVCREALANGFKENDQGDWKKAQASFKTVLEADPQNAAAYYGMGYAYYLEGNHAASTEAYSTALSLDPEPSAQKVSRPPPAKRKTKKKR